MPIRVLVIDDDADFQSMIRLALQSQQDIAVIGEAEDGETGLALARQQQPDIVLMDLMMPRLSGFEATRQTKRSHPGVKILVLTSFVDDAMRQEAYRSGADAFLGKRDLATALVPMIRQVTGTTSRGAGLRLFTQD